MRGTPVIACDCRGARESFEHGVTGWVVPTPTMSALADALVAALSDFSLCQRFGEAGRDSALAASNEDEWISSTRDLRGNP